MKPEKIRAIIGEQIKEIKKPCGNIGNDFDKECIHEFRVAVKSLRSFLRLLRMVQDEASPRLSRECKRLYHIAGAIRDAQLELERLEADKITLPVYADKLTHDIARQKKEWARNYDETIFSKMKKKLSAFEYMPLPPTALEDFYNTKIGEVEELSDLKAPTNAQIHSIRKQAKDILYTARLAKKEWKPAYKEARHIAMKQLDNIATAIGDYNDNRTQLEHMTSFYTPTMGAEEKERIKEICRNDTAKLKSGKKNILSMVRKLGG